MSSLKPINYSLILTVISSLLITHSSGTATNTTKQEPQLNSTSSPTAATPRVYLFDSRHVDCHKRNGSCDDCTRNSDCYYCSGDKSCHHYERRGGPGVHTWRRQCLHLRDMYWDTCAMSVQSMAIICMILLVGILLASVGCCCCGCRSADVCRRRRRREMATHWAEMADRRVAGQERDRQKERNDFLKEFRIKYSKRPADGQTPPRAPELPINTDNNYVRF